MKFFGPEGVAIPDWQPFPASEVKNVSGGDVGPFSHNWQARREALSWLSEALKVVSTVYPQVDFGRVPNPAVQDAFDDALARRFWGGEILGDEFMAAWRALYQECL